MARTEGIDLVQEKQTKLVQTAMKDLINKFKTDEKSCLKTFGKPFDQVTDKELQDYEEGFKKGADNMLNEQLTYMKELYTRIIAKKGIIKAGTPEAAKAHAYLEASRNYVRPEENKAQYFKNLLETEAYAAGDNIERQFKAFMRQSSQS